MGFRYMDLKRVVTFGGIFVDGERYGCFLGVLGNIKAFCADWFRESTQLYFEWLLVAVFSVEVNLDLQLFFEFSLVDVFCYGGLERRFLFIY